MIDDFLKLIGSLFFKVFFELIGFYTGEIILFLLTLGQKKIKWDYYAEEKPSKFIIFTELSIWIGILFWICVILIINKLLSS